MSDSLLKLYGAWKHLRWPRTPPNEPDWSDVHTAFIAGYYEGSAQKKLSTERAAVEGELLPLPEPTYAVNNVEKRYYTADDMREYALSHLRTVPLPAGEPIGSIELGEHDGVAHRERVAILNERAQTLPTGALLYASAVPPSPVVQQEAKDIDGVPACLCGQPISDECKASGCRWDKGKNHG